MHITLVPEPATIFPDLLAPALAHTRPVVGPLRFRTGGPGSVSGTQPLRQRRDGPPLKRERRPKVGTPGIDWQPFRVHDPLSEVGAYSRQVLRAMNGLGRRTRMRPSGTVKRTRPRLSTVRAAGSGRKAIHCHSSTLLPGPRRSRNGLSA